MVSWVPVQTEGQAILQRSTIHGLTHVYKARTPATRIFWIVLCLSGAVGFVTNLLFIVERFYEHPVLTTYIPHYDLFQWPDITFCNPSAPIPFSKFPHLVPKWNKLLNESRSKFGNLTTIADDIPGLIFALSSLSPHEYYMHDIPGLLATWGLDQGNEKIDRSIEFQNNMNLMPEEVGSQAFFTTQVHLRYPSLCHTFQISRLNQMKGNEDVSQRARQLFFIVTDDYNAYEIYNSDYVMRGVFMYINKPQWLVQDHGHMILPAYNSIVKMKMTRTKYLENKRNCRKNHFTVGVYDPVNTKAWRKYHGSETDCKRYHSQKVSSTFPIIQKIKCLKK